MIKFDRQICPDFDVKNFVKYRDLLEYSEHFYTTDVFTTAPISFVSYYEHLCRLRILS